MSRYDLDADEEMVRRALEASLQENQFETGLPDEFAVPPPRAGSRGNRGRPQFNTTPFGDDDGLDPQLALALRLSMEEEERRKQEEEKAKEEAANKRIQEEKAKKEEEERMRQQNERNNISPPHSSDHSTADETPPLSAEQQRELIRQSWLQKWGQGNSQPQPESTATVHTMNIDDNLVDTNVNRNSQKANVIVLSSDDEEEDSLQSRRKGQRRGRPRHRSVMDEDQVNVTGENVTVDSPEIDRRKPWKFPREESPPPPPDNDDSIMSDEVIARHLQEAEMRAETEDLEDDYVYNPPPSAFTNPSYGHPVSPSAQLLRRQQLEEDEEAERGRKKEEEERMLKLLREEQEKEDEAYAQQLQLMEQENEDEDVGDLIDEVAPPLGGGGGDWGVPSTAPVVVQRVTRTVTSPTSGRRVVTTTTTTRSSSSSSSSSSATRGARRRSSDLSGLLSVLQSRGGIHRHPDAFAGMLSGDMNNPSHAFVGGDFGDPQYNDGYGLRRYHGIPLNYLRHSRGNDDELDVDNMSYEELLNLPTVERGVDDKNIFPVIKYVKGSDPSNTQCTVCLEDFEDAEELRVLPCFHKFHKKCIDTWLDSHKNCPVCKHDLAD